MSDRASPIAREPTAPSVLLGGIDEAGYGPRLGPLCVALTLFEAPIASPTAASDDVNLWALLRAAVCRDHVSARKGKIAVADSKRLKGVGGAKVDPLFHLERGVLAFESLARHDPSPSSESELLHRLGVKSHSASNWYEGDRPLPRVLTSEQMSIVRSQLAGACDEARVRPMLVRCAAMDESTFNERYAQLGNKASVSFGIVGGMLRRLKDTHAEPGPPLFVTVDRQGGRAYYRALLESALESTVEPVEESETRSAYEVVGGRRPMRVEFRVEAESTSLPVALASMTAKYVREILMNRFNHYWCARIEGLRPTAGYGTDAGRWLTDVRGRIPTREVEALIRRA